MLMPMNTMLLWPPPPLLCPMIKTIAKMAVMQKTHALPLPQRRRIPNKGL